MDALLREARLAVNQGDSSSSYDDGIKSGEEEEKEEEKDNRRIREKDT